MTCVYSMCQPCQTTSTNATLCQWCRPSGSSIQFPYLQRTLNFERYGKSDIQTLGNHFFQGEENSDKQAKLEAEWNNFKYELSDWSKDYQAISSPTITSTELALQRFLRHKASYSRMYPPLLQVAEVCLSMPVSNAWPEREASALKRLKTRLRNSLKKQMLESVHHTTINGPPAQ